MEKKGTMSNIVLDSSAVLNSQALQFDFECYTIPEVLDEARDVRSKVAMEYAVDSGLLRVRSPSQKALLDAARFAKSTGDFETLSETDLKVLALAKELEAEIWTDDYAMQNVAHAMHLKYRAIAFKPMKRHIRWKRKCPNCGRIYSTISDCDRCEVCDARLVRTK